MTITIKPGAVMAPKIARIAAQNESDARAFVADFWAKVEAARAAKVGAK